MLIELEFRHGKIVYDDIIQIEVCTRKDKKKEMLLIRRLNPNKPLSLDLSEDRAENTIYGYLTYVWIYGLGYEKHVRPDALPQDLAGQGV